MLFNLWTYLKKIICWLRTLELVKTHLVGKPKSASDVDSKVTVDFIIQKTENAISRGANEL